LNLKLNLRYSSVHTGVLVHLCQDQMTVHSFDSFYPEDALVPHSLTPENEPSFYFVHDILMPYFTHEDFIDLAGHGLVLNKDRKNDHS
ncbi:hypothetical protein BB559_005565, partial [Furculomyces boomerangus]